LVRGAVGNDIIERLPSSRCRQKVHTKNAENYNDFHYGSISTKELTSICVPVQPSRLVDAHVVPDVEAVIPVCPTSGSYTLSMLSCFRNVASLLLPPRR
jgi:hypothetical protein